ncbi:RNA polymerase sigma factor, sigma-70 family [Luteitalea pratensis]|uniref:RNA polymerase sigma factor, sigma-70 family n=1 Tax=Luteitalea pratensis TaxID=1855912 RepID=A0A143PJH3_LUTPR|nr:sigma-70 family RNA polymerase sigma factor [Luteitalea pratensis]AMY08715.1 RNA polymerase sigma factor, sigma-70 family [Luteitalea pratensis]
MLTSPLAPADFSLLSDVIATVSRTSGLPAEDAMDFSQHVHLKLLERNYAPLKRFAGRSSLKTFITVVVRRQLLDWRNRHYGKWRPCEAARRLGHAAIHLDRLISRDGHQVDDAVAIMATRPECADETVLRALATQLPQRIRARTVATDDFEGISPCSFDDPVEARQDEEQTRVRRERLRLACLALPPDDRRLLHLRFGRGLAVSDVARLMGEPAKPLYRRLDRIVSALRSSLVNGDAATCRRSCRRHCVRSGSPGRKTRDRPGHIERE